MTVGHLFSTKMAVTMGVFWFSLILSIIGCNAAGEFSILHSPDSLKFSGSDKAPETLLKEIFSASLGLSVEENSEWNGLSITDPFNTPEAVVEVYVDGVTNLGSTVAQKAKNFGLIVDEYEPDTFVSIKHRINQRYNDGRNVLVDVNLRKESDLRAFSELFGPVSPAKPTKRSLQHLKESVEEDYQFLSELDTLKALTAKIASGVSADNIIDFYNFRFVSLHPLSDYHGPNSLQTKEAKKLLGEALLELSDAFEKAYDGSVLVVAVATDVAHTRTVRAVMPYSETQSQENNVADNYSADYAAIFNIILWFGVVLTFSLVAIVYALADMDPGRDSIIYRMTSTRMKKDN